MITMTSRSARTRCKSLLCVIVIFALGTGRTFAVAERKISFNGAGNVKLAGTLLLPNVGKGSTVPGVIIVAGSGPTDRDGNQGSQFQPNFLKQIAEGLAARGVASLRYDKRGVGDSKMPAMDNSALASYASWENFVGDAIGAFNFLSRQPQIDARRIGMMGHSEGGLIVIDAANKLSHASRPPRVLVLISTPGRTVDAVVQDQLRRLLSNQGATSEQTRFYLDKNRAIVEAIRSTGAVPDDVPEGLKALYPPYLGPFYKSLLALDPAVLVTKFGGPVFVIQGQMDNQVSATLDAAALDRALTRRVKDDHRLLVVPSASHMLKPVSSENDPGISGPIRPLAMGSLCDWLKRKL